MRATFAHRRGVIARGASGSGSPTSPVALRSYNTASASFSSSWSVNSPAGVQSGDLILLTITRSAASGAAPTISGFTQIAAQVGGINQLRAYLYYKVAGGSEPASYTIGWGAVSWGVVVCAAYLGADTTSPVQSSASADGGGTSGTTCTTPSGLTATGTGTLAAHFVFGNTASSGSPTYTWSTPPTEQVDYWLSTSGKTSLTIADEAVAAGSITTRTATCAISTYYASVTALINPAP